MPVAPPIVNDVTYVSTINHDSHLAFCMAVFGEV